MTELTRLAAELPHVGADTAWARLDRLTETQRTAIEDVLRRVDREWSSLFGGRPCADDNRRP